jgi:hypothetical protein
VIRLSSRSCTQGAARAALEKIGPPMPDQIAPIMEGLRDSDPDVREGTLEFAKTLTSEQPGLVMDAAHALNDSNAAVRLTAIEVLEKIHPEGEGRYPLLKPYAGSPVRALRERALRLIGQIGVTGKVGIGLAEDYLTDPEASLRLESARLITAAEPKHDKARTTLMALAGDVDSHTGEEAAAILRKLAPFDAKIAKALAPFAARERSERLQAIWSRSTPEQRRENGRSLKVLGIRMAHDVQNNDPVEPARVFPASVKRVFCWLEVTVSSAPAAVHQLWYLNDQLKKDQMLEVIDPLDHVWSSLAIEPGHWHVDVRSETSSEPLATAAFTVIKSSRSRR